VRPQGRSDRAIDVPGLVNLAGALAYGAFSRLTKSIDPAGVAPAAITLAVTCFAASNGMKFRPVAVLREV
jgi:hypothetical protein